MIHVYTDGACSGNPGPGGWAAVILDNDNRLLEEISGFRASTTNNRMEIQAAISGLKRALEIAPGVPLVLYSDSSYLINAYTKGWMGAWLNSNWKNGSVKNQDLWQELNALVRPVKVRWVKVKGHADNPYNNRCDQLAVAAIKQQSTGVPAGTGDKAPLPGPKDDAKSHGRIMIDGVKIPGFDPVALNNPLSDKPSENRCLVSVSELAENIRKIKQVASRFAYADIKNSFSPETLNSVNSSVAFATFNHPTRKVHPYFLQAGDMADWWLAKNLRRERPYPAPTRSELVKLICAFIVEKGLEQAERCGL